MTKVKEILAKKERKYKWVEKQLKDKGSRKQRRAYKKLMKIYKRNPQPIAVVGDMAILFSKVEGD